MSSEPSPVMKRWIQAMPSPLKPYWQHMRGFLRDGSFFINALKEDGYSLEELSLDLFYWYGSGYGPWSGYPMYEQVAGFLLGEISTIHLVNVALNSPLSDTYLEGITRYFCGSAFLRSHKDEMNMLPKELLQIMLDYLVHKNDSQKLAYFNTAFGTIKM